MNMLHVVTGAAGFIGSRLVAALNRAGISEILAVDNLGSSADKFTNLVGVRDRGLPRQEGVPRAA